MDENELIVKTEDKSDQVGKTKTIYSVGEYYHFSGEIALKHLIIEKDEYP